MISYTLTRSKRKTLALYVRNGQLEVRAPLRAYKGDIDKFVLSKEQWIADKLEDSRKRQEQRRAFALNYGDMLLYHGKEYPINPKLGGAAGFDSEGFYMPPGLSQEQIKYACVKIYRKLAKCYLTNRALHLAKEMGVMPVAVKVNGAKRRWGSCSGKKRLNFSWRLIMAERDVIDYVLIHELAHLTEMNHSKRFWAIVEGFLPDYKERQESLKDLQKKLSAEAWE